MGIEILIILIFGIIVGFLIGSRILDKKIKKISERCEIMIDEAKNDAKNQINTAEIKAHQIIEKAEIKGEKIIQQSEKNLEQQMNLVEKRENSLLLREEKIEKRESLIEKERREIVNQKIELEKNIERQIQKLENISGMSAHEARADLLQNIAHNNKIELKKFSEKLKIEKQLTAKQEAMQIIATVMPKISNDYIGEYTSVMVDLPSEETKGRIIGREGRNITFFERITGVNLIIDDTPLSLKISSHDPEKRFIAQLMLYKLVKEGRINPVQIEKEYNHAVENFTEHVNEKGEEAFRILNIPIIHPDLSSYVGKFFFRYSYGQNLRNHSIEVAKIAGLIAEELGLDSMLAKKAGLLHDIGKVVSESGEAHTTAGGQILRQYRISDVVINAAESHHYDIEMIHPICRIISAADTLSASRPGARFEAKEVFIERMQQLEELVLKEDRVQKTYIMQAGREIIVFMHPEQISDEELDYKIKLIGANIEQALDYPGVVRIVGIRESKTIHYLR